MPNYKHLIDKWVRVEAPETIEHDFTFVKHTVKIPVESGERRMSLWLAYLATCHPEIKITPLEF